MNDKNSIEIRLLTIPWVTYTKRSFNLTNIGNETAVEVGEGSMLYVSKATQNGNTGYLVFNVIKDIHCFWPEDNNNIQEYLTMINKRGSWRKDITILQEKKEEFILKIGPKG